MKKCAIERKGLMILLVLVLSISVFGCSNTTVSDVSTKENEVNDEGTTINKDSSSNNNDDDTKEDIQEYYTFLKTDGGGLTLNLSTEEFLENYNSIKAPYENHSYKDLGLSDFNFIASNTTINGTAGNFYGCPLTINGLNDDILTCFFQEADSSNLCYVCLGVHNSNLYSKNPDNIWVQYKLLMRAIGIPEYDVENIVNEMVDNGKKYGVVATYHKGIAAYIEPIDDLTDWFRIIPYTKEQWKQASSLNLIPID